MGETTLFVTFKTLLPQQQGCFADLKLVHFFVLPPKLPMEMPE
jgi:hypothetical protein